MAITVNERGIGCNQRHLREFRRLEDHRDFGYTEPRDLSCRHSSSHPDFSVSCDGRRNHRGKHASLQLSL